VTQVPKLQSYPLHLFRSCEGHVWIAMVFTLVSQKVLIGHGRQPIPRHLCHRRPPFAGDFRHLRLDLVGTDLYRLTSNPAWMKSNVKPSELKGVTLPIRPW
jgi:hypothetical protein